MPRYVELQVTSHFSFLRGASSPEELFTAAKLLGHDVLGLADRGTVGGGWYGGGRVRRQQGYVCSQGLA